jgi:TetR/AcrR family transcriptional regulator, transcriptional repressor for nem operon
MGRPPEYDRDTVLSAAGGLFGTLGYAGCSVEDLVQGLGIHRGSLYKAFGSKHGLFIEALRHHVGGPLARLADTLAAHNRGRPPEMRAANAPELDLLLVAAVEAGTDPAVQQQVNAALTSLGRAVLVDSEASETDARAAGLRVLTCRLAYRCLPKRELQHHLPLLSPSITRKDSNG